MTDEKVPLCVDCGHCVESSSVYYCKRTAKTDESPVDGERKTQMRACSNEREDGPPGWCRRKGRFFEIRKEW